MTKENFKKAVEIADRKIAAQNAIQLIRNLEKRVSAKGQFTLQAMTHSSGYDTLTVPHTVAEHVLDMVKEHYKGELEEIDLEIETLK